MSEHAQCQGKLRCVFAQFIHEQMYPLDIESLVGSDHRHIGDPLLMRCRGLEILLQNIRCLLVGGILAHRRRSHASGTSRQALLAHQAGHTLA